MDKLFRRLGFKDDYGWEDTSIVGFIVLWSLFGYGAYQVVLAIIERFSS